MLNTCVAFRSATAWRKIKLIRRTHVVPLLPELWVGVEDEPDDVLLVGHDGLVQGAVAVVVARARPPLLVQHLAHAHQVAADHLLVDRVDLLLKRI